MRSWSIPIGRLFGVDVRIHLTFFILPMFIFWTDYAVNQRQPPDLAIWQSWPSCWRVSPPMNADTCWPRAGLASFPKAVILLPLTGVALV
jgi:hypothetical protein